MMTKRATGSYYTPSPISDFIVKRVCKKHSGKKLEILEPSAGDGVFVRSLYQSDLIQQRLFRTTAIELNIVEGEKIKEHINSKSLSVICADFLVYQQQLASEKFDIILGNPPYIKKNLLTSDQVELSQNIHKNFPKLSTSSIKNIWSAFLVSSIRLLKKNGILSFVLPAELLQVKFTAELRELLINEFQRIEIFTFNELLFNECKGQDTLVLIAEKTSNEPGLFFHNVMDTQELEADDFHFTEKDTSETSKWTTHCLTQSEVILLNRLKSSLKTLDELCDSKAGIVTGANKYFILNQERTKQNKLEKYSRPIIQKGAFVKSWIKFDEEDFGSLVRNQTPCFLIDLNNAKINKASKVNEYLLQGTSTDIDKGYKTKIREKWYEVPNIGNSAQGLFFKRCHVFPKFIINEAKALATDSAYLVNAKEGIDINSLVLSFYNSLTLVFSEINGRFYGGGVLELTPNEFRSLPIPYVKISDNDYLKYLQLFQSDRDLNLNIRELDDFFLKRTIPDITDGEIETLRTVREKLVSRRQRL